jgi:hypothetical protein
MIVHRNAVPGKQTSQPAAVDTLTDKPYRMQSILESPLLGLTIDEILHNPQFVVRARFKSPGVVENISIVICKDEFVLDVMHAALHRQDTHDQPSQTNTSLRLPNLH